MQEHHALLLPVLEVARAGARFVPGKCAYSRSCRGVRRINNLLCSLVRVAFIQQKQQFFNDNSDDLAQLSLIER